MVTPDVSARISCVRSRESGVLPSGQGGRAGDGSASRPYPLSRQRRFCVFCVFCGSIPDSYFLIALSLLATRKPQVLYRSSDGAMLL